MTPSQLFHTRKKGKTAISIIISTKNIPDTESLALQIRKTVDKTESLLDGMFPLKEMHKLIKELELLVSNIKYEHNVQGMGIYVIPGEPGMVVPFPFPVKDKIHLGDSFWIRELLYLDYYSVEYYVLELSHKIAMLYKGKLNTLVAVKDNRFPHFLEKNEYEKVTHDYFHNIGVKIIEADKPELHNIIERNSLLTIDNKLAHYLGEYPLIISGTEKQLLLFHEITNHWTHIVGNITGNFRDESLSLLSDHVWPEIKEWLDKRKDVVANEWLEKKALHKITGIRDIWKAAVEGLGKILLVEKDHSLSAYQDTADGDIHLKPPQSTIRIISDAVDEIMKIVLDQKGEVIIVENGTLSGYQHMVLLT